MGGRGSSGGANVKAKPKSRFSKVVEKQTQPEPEPKKKTTTAFSPAEFVKTQTGVDLEKYRDSTTRRFDKRGVIIVDWKRMPETARQKIMVLSTRQYTNNIEIEEFGTWGMQIRKKRKK